MPVPIACITRPINKTGKFVEIPDTVVPIIKKNH